MQIDYFTHNCLFRLVPLCRIFADPVTNSGIRLCVDMQMANKQSSKYHVFPTIDDLMNGMCNSSLKNACYHQFTYACSKLPLHDIYTHRGLWLYVRLNFGTNPASEFLSEIIDEQICCIPRVLNIMMITLFLVIHKQIMCHSCFASLHKFKKKTLSKVNRNLIIFGFIFSNKGITLTRFRQ